MLLRTHYSVDDDVDSTFDLPDAVQLIVERAGLQNRGPGLGEYQWASIERTVRNIVVRACVEAALALNESGNVGRPFIRLIRVAALTSGLAEMGAWNTDEALDSARERPTPADYVDTIEQALKWARMDDPSCDWAKQGPDERWTLSDTERLGVERAVSEIRHRALIECVGIVAEFAD